MAAEGGPARESHWANRIVMMPFFGLPSFFILSNIPTWSLSSHLTSCDTTLTARRHYPSAIRSTLTRHPLVRRQRGGRCARLNISARRRTLLTRQYEGISMVVVCFQLCRLFKFDDRPPGLVYLNTATEPQPTKPQKRS